MIERYSLPRMVAIWADQNKFQKMLEVELYACEAFSKLGLIPKSSYLKLKKRARFSVARIQEIEAKTKHDVVAFVSAVSENLGPEARFLHMGLTSSDVVDTAMALQIQEACRILVEDLEKLAQVLRRLALKYKRTVCIGRSHGIHAEPTTFGLKLLGFYEETSRNLAGLKDAKEQIRFGKISGSVGTYANVDPRVEAHVCRRLNLNVEPVSTQVVPRDRYAVLLARIAIAGAGLERIATEIRGLQRTEILEVEEPFSEGQKGSSSMPHKRNPVTCERVVGLARVLRGNAQASLENIALWHERDISHSSVERVIVPDSTILLDYMTHLMIEVLSGLVVYPENMARNIGKTRGLVFSQQVLLALIDKGLSRREAYDVVQTHAMRAWRNGTEFRELLRKDDRVRRVLKERELDACFDPAYHTKHVDRIFSRVLKGKSA